MFVGKWNASRMICPPICSTKNDVPLRLLNCGYKCEKAFPCNQSPGLNNISVFWAPPDLCFCCCSVQNVWHEKKTKTRDEMNKLSNFTNTYWVYINLAVHQFSPALAIMITKTYYTTCCGCHVTQRENKQPNFLKFRCYAVISMYSWVNNLQLIVVT